MSQAADKTPIQYPKTHTVEQIDDYFGAKVPDPYRWMEDVDSTDVKTWVDAENVLTHHYLSTAPRAASKMHARLMELINFERYTAPARRGTRYFYTHNEGLQNQNVVFWQEGLTGEPHVLLDPNTHTRRRNRRRSAVLRHRQTDGQLHRLLHRRGQVRDWRQDGTSADVDHWQRDLPDRRSE